MSSVHFTFQHDLSDISQLAELEIKSTEEKILKKPFPEVIRGTCLSTAETVLEAIRDDGAKLVTTSHDDNVVGYLAYSNNFINGVYTLPVEPSQPVGKILLHRLINSEFTVNSWSLSTIPEAAEAHQRNGFIHAPTEDDENRMVMPPEHVAMWKNSSGGAYPVFVLS